MSEKISVTIQYDDDANVWIATSDDALGLVLESGSFDALVERVRVVVPELLELNSPGSHLSAIDFNAVRTIPIGA